MVSSPTTAATPSASLVTSWLPITTAWSAPSVCSSLLWGGTPPWLALNDPAYGIYENQDISCLPSAATQWWEQPKDLYLSTAATTPLTTYILGPITCPQAYTTATTSVQDSSTFVACCPSHYSFASILSDGHAGQCISEITAGQAVSIVLFTTITDTNKAASAWVTSVSTVTSDTTVNGIQMNGFNIAPQTSSSNSAPVSTSASITSASFGAKTTETDSTQTSTSANSPPAHNANTGLSAKESIGIGIGVAFGVIAIAVLVAGAFWYRRRRRAAIDMPYGPTTRDQGYKATASLSVQEMHSGFYGHEMEGTRPVGELYGGDPQNR